MCAAKMFTFANFALKSRFLMVQKLICDKKNYVFEVLVLKKRCLSLNFKFQFDEIFENASWCV